MTKTKNPTPPYLANVDAERTLLRALGRVIDRSTQPLGVKLNALGRIAVHIQQEMQKQQPAPQEARGDSGAPIAAP